MNYYERIQRSIEYIEENLCEDISLEQCASEAYMSLSGYYRMFFSIVGMSVKEYIRSRRLSSALKELYAKPGIGILEIAIRYGFNSADGFSRSFKRQFGILPSQVKHSESKNKIVGVERLDIMEELFEKENQEMSEKYPDIKVIKELPEMKVACFSYYGTEPEGHAFDQLKKWYQENELSMYESSNRLFGYNNPDPQEGATEYAYEFCITIPEELYEKLEDVPASECHNTYSKVYRKVHPAGKYAVMSVLREDGTDLGYSIMMAWQRFLRWIDESKYIWGNSQYLEEHLGFNEEDNHIGGVDLYFSIQEDKKNLVSTVTEVKLDQRKVVVFREDGIGNFEEINQKCWKRAIGWANQSGLKSEECKIYQYNQGYSREKEVFNVVMIAVPEEYEIQPSEGGVDQVDILSEATYACIETTWEEEGNAWSAIGKWCKKNKKKNTEGQWLEECSHNNWCPSGKIHCLLLIEP